ncbi:polysialyltransferase family glycosyltransferase [Streptomyces sp. WMMC500]|uniref:polysialyltransferase family glycosyltransferase n=1 Tax=Streptomyces sp. WMMC500 TaxID=3015154 RepID=UPI00248C9916|nr:polysialyltransferase family glycosyltransferase [Streptomyces sp. WMMC500]WBB58912.1 polysialyltransferase family glycosyltransferase [Streptomyces sp. WMMC500]
MHEHRTQIFEVSTLYGAATLAAALDAGQFGPRADARRILLVANNATVPETATRLSEMHGWTPVSARFDEVLDYNHEIRPHHPAAWHPKGGDVPLLQRLLRRAWDLGDGPLDLVVESVTAPPAKALVAIFADADVHVYADGLMSYGPTRERLPQHVACRVQRLLHLDLVPGLEPLLLTEYGVPAEVVPNEAFRAVLDEVAAAAPAPAADPEGEGAPTAVLLGQYLAALNILSHAEEEALHERMLRGAAAAGHRSVLFKPHPTAPARYSTGLQKAAADAGVTLTVQEEPMLAEALYGTLRPRLVVGCFSTAMLTAATLYDIPVARVGTETLLERLTPYQNSNRIPVTIVDSVVPELGGPDRPARDAAQLAGLLVAVGYCMQADNHARLRSRAQEWLAVYLDAGTRPYFKRKRLTALRLPGGNLGRVPNARRALGKVRRALTKP